MTITMHCHVSTNYSNSAIDEDIQVDVPDDFLLWDEEKQYEHLQDEFDNWLGSNMDSGFSISI